MTGAMFMAHCLQQEGVTKVFGQCGHTNYALIDACHKLGIEYVSFRHEQQAAHAADAYFRVSHKLAVVNVHLSPGLTNAITGVATAAGRLDADGRHLRQHAVVSPRARAASGHPLPRRRVAGRHLSPVLQARLAHRRCEVPRGRDAARAERRADRTAGRGAARRADGRLLAAHRRAEPVTVAPPPELRAAAAATAGIADAGRSAAAASRRRSSPATARCCRKRRPNCAQVAELLAMPVATTLMAKGDLPGGPRALARHDGHLGHARRRTRRRARRRHPRRRHRLRRGRLQLVESETHVRDSRRRKLIQIDIDPQEIGKIYPVDVGIVGDAKTTLRAARRRAARLDAERRRRAAARRHARKAACELERGTRRRAAQQRQADPSRRGCSTRSRRRRRATRSSSPTSAGTRTAPDSSCAGYAADLHHERRRWRRWGSRRRRRSARRSARPTRPSSAWSATAVSSRSCGALTTAVELGIPVVWVIFNNFCFSTIRTVGTTYFNNAYGTEFTTPDGEPYNPDFVMLAQGLRHRLGAGRGARRSAGGADDGARGRRALPARSPDARRRADAAHRPLGHRGFPRARQRLGC